MGNRTFLIALEDSREALSLSTVECIVFCVTLCFFILSRLGHGNTRPSHNIYIYAIMLYISEVPRSDAFNALLIRNVPALVKRTGCHSSADVPWLATRCLCVFVWAHGLLFVVGTMCSPVYCLTPPFLLSHYCFSYPTSDLLVILLVCLPISSPGVCSPVLFGCLMSDVTLCVCYLRLPACLLPPPVLLLKQQYSPGLESIFVHIGVLSNLKSAQYTAFEFIIDFLCIKRLNHRKSCN